MKIRSLAVLPVLALGVLSLAGCDSKAGTAAVVDGKKISESNLNSYLTGNVQPIQSGDGSSSTPAKLVVLQYLVSNEVLSLLLSNNGTPATDSQLDAQRDTVLGGSSEADLTNQITKVGLKAKFEPVVLRNNELRAILQQKIKSSDGTAALAKVKDKVSVNPRYGSWDPQALSLSDLGKKQLPSMLSYDGTLPGDVKAPTGQ